MKTTSLLTILSITLFSTLSFAQLGSIRPIGPIDDGVIGGIDEIDEDYNQPGIIDDRLDDRYDDGLDDRHNGRHDDRYDDGLDQNRQLRLELNLQEEEFSSRHGTDTVALKALLRRHYGHLPLEQMDLKKVVVLAKSQMGRAQMSLLTGHQMSAAQTIAGNPHVYHRRAVGLQRYIFQARGREGRGVWQLKIQGNVKVARIMVVLGESMLRH